MALCVILNPDGTLSPTSDAVGDCAGYVMISGSEYSLHATLDHLFDYPTAETALGWLVGSFAFVFGTFVIARLVGTVISMFDD